MKILFKERLVSLIKNRCTCVIHVCIMLLMFFSTNLSAKNLNQLIYLQTQNQSIRTVFKELKKQSGYFIVYNEKEIDKELKVNVDIKGKPLEESLQLILADLPLDYNIEDEYVFIKRKAFVPVKAAPEKKRVITGIVKDSRKDPIIGVNVFVKGTQIGIVTDFDGKYRLEVPLDAEILVFSFIGMEKEEVKIKEQTVINVVMREDEQGLDEVVVLGYQQVHKDRVTGSIERISSKDMIDMPFASMDQLLGGKISGLTSFMESGQAGKNADIRIRGVNTLNGSTQPLWIVDGLPLQGEVPDVSGGGSALEANILNNGVGNIPASDIKSITVLKDAAAAAIYGARAANGVIIIETKTGHEGEIFCNFNGSYSISQAPNQSMNFMNTAEKIEFERSIFEDFSHDYRMTKSRGGSVYKILYDVRDGNLTKEEGEAKINELAKYNTNWYDEIFRNSISKSYGINISGGNKKLTYYFSANRTEDEGTMRNDNYENTSIRMKGSFKPNEKFDITFGLNTTIRDKEYHNSVVNPLTYATYANPYEHPYNEDGSYAYDQTYLFDSYKKGLTTPTFGNFNILNELANTGYNSKYKSTGASVNLQYYIFKELRFSSKFIATNTDKTNDEFANPGTYRSYTRNWYKKMISRDLREDENVGYFKKNNVASEEYSFNNTLEFSKEWKNKFYTSLFLGQEISAIKTNDFYTFMPEYFPKYDIVGYPNITDIDGANIDLTDFGNKGFKEKRYSSFFSALTIGYNDTYILNFNARKDGADIIGNNERFTPLWSTSARWNIHKENFFKGIEFMDELSLKAEYGFTGNINRNVYPFTVINLSGTDRYNGKLVAKNYSYPNPAIKWEKKEEKSIGINASMFNYRLNYGFNYYYNSVSDVLGNRVLPTSAGTRSLFANVSNLLNKGYEFNFNYSFIKRADLRASFNFNIAYNKNEISNSYYASLYELNLLSCVVPKNVDGYSVGSVFGFRDKGVNPETGDRLVEVRKAIFSTDGTNVPTGEYELTTMDRNRVSMENDKAIHIGDLNPKYNGGFGLTASYKNWEFNSHFTYEAGHVIRKFSERISSPYGRVPTSYARLNVLKDKQHRWRQSGDITDVDEFRILQLDSHLIPLDSDYEKGDYIKLKNIILSYRLPSDIIKKMNIGITRAKFSFQASNLWTITNYSGIDPETRSDFGYPIPRTFRFNLNIGI